MTLAMLRALPPAELYTSFYDPELTYPGFSDFTIHTTALNQLPFVRTRHRLAFPIFRQIFSRMHVDADVLLCSSAGWSHGIPFEGRKVVFCHNPPRWLYQTEQYLGGSTTSPAALSIRALRTSLEAWDRDAAASADAYIANSTIVAQRIRDAYGIEAAIVHPPHTIDVAGEQQPVEDTPSAFALCVARLLPYKNVAQVIDAFSIIDDLTLTVVGDGPLRETLTARLPPNVRILSGISDSQLRWLYARCSLLVGASFEDFGLTPVEAAAFGRPSAALRWGGYLDTVEDGVSGHFFETPSAESIAACVEQVASRRWDGDRIREHAAAFDESAFIDRLEPYLRGS